MKKVVVLLVSIQSGYLNGLHDDFQRGGSSKALVLVNTCLGKVAKPVRFHGPYDFDMNFIHNITEAPDEFKKMAREAQEVYQLPYGQRLPVYQARLEGFNGIAQAHAIYLDEKLKNKSYGARRFTIYHEVAHTQYCDAARGILRLLVPFSISSILVAKTFPDGFLSTMLVNSYMMAIWLLLYQRFAATALYNDERRADMQAAYACNCFACVQEKAETRGNRTSNGYLSKTELLAIARNHKKNKNTCDYHRSFITS